MIDEDKTPPILANVPMPSADLMNYFIKETKDNFVAVNTKLDVILSQNANFITEERAQQIVNTALQPYKSQSDNQRWYWRAVVTAILFCLGGVVVALIKR